MGKLFKTFRNNNKEVKKKDDKPREVFRNVDEAMAYVKSTEFKQVES